MDKFLIIDGNSLLNRAFYALPLLTNKNGEYSNAVYGFSNMLIKAITEIKPKYLCVAFDYGKKNFRHELFSEYKGTRKKTPTELVEQFALAKKMLSYMDIKYVEKSGIEADDIIGTLSKSTDVETIILSGDKDILQLIDKSTTVWLTKKGISEVDQIDIDKLKEEFGWTPQQVIEYKSLCGDSSDNIPGVSGIGDKTANKLLETFENLDNIYNHLDEIDEKTKNKLINNKEMAYLSKKLATIDTNCNIEKDLGDMTYHFPFSQNVFNFFEEYDFRSLMKREDLFEQKFEIKPFANEIEVEIVELQDISKLPTIIKIIKEEGRFAFKVGDKLEFAMTNGIRYVVEKELNLFNDGKNLDDWINGLKEVFQNPKIIKIFYDAKSILHYLDNYSISVKNYFDISVAKYLESQGVKVISQDLHVDGFFQEYEELKTNLINLGLDKLYNQIELPLIDVLFNMEKIGFKIDLNQLDNLSVAYKQELSNLEENIFNLIGHEFNLNSPKQLAQVLFEELGLYVKNNKKQSTSVDVLNELVGQHQVIELILRYRKIQKLYSTYIEAWQTQFATKNGIIHTMFNQTQTSTGRLSSSEPNLQNIPVRDEEGKNLRKLFVSQFEGGKIISADYNQIELRLLANLSKDEKLIEAFKSGKDIHRTTASTFFNIPFENVTDNQRRQAKAVNFGVIYGISDYGLSQNAGISRKDAKAYIEKYFEVYPKVKEYMQNNVEIAKKDGKISTHFGRIRKIDEIKSSNFAQRSFGERVAMNMPLQGTASDIIKIAMIKVFGAINSKNLKSKLILQIHDELIVDAYPGEENEITNILHNEMENVVNFEVKLPVEVNAGKSWFDCK